MSPVSRPFCHADEHFETIDAATDLDAVLKVIRADCNFLPRSRIKHR